MTGRIRQAAFEGNGLESLVDRSFPIVRHPAPAKRTPVLVSVPHYGTQPLPHITRDDYREPWFETFVSPQGDASGL